MLPAALNRQRLSHLLATRWFLACALLVCLPASPVAAGIISLRTDGDGTPLVLFGSGVGHVGFNARYLRATSDGYLQVYDQVSSGHEFHTLDPSLESPNNARSGAQAQLTQVWNTSKEYYEAAVSANTKVASGSLANSGFSRPLPNQSLFSWSGGGTITYTEFQFQDTSDTTDSTSGHIARRANGTAGVQTGLHKTGLDWVAETAPGSDAYQVLGGLAVGGTGNLNNGVVKMMWGPLTGLDTVTPAAGTRAISAGGFLIGGASGTRQSLLADLVPGIDDSVTDFAYNPLDQHLYFLSQDAASNRVFLSAVEFGWGLLADDSLATYVDLSAEDLLNDYLEITYDSGDSNEDLMRAGSLAFSADGSRLFVAGGTSSSNAQVFQFNVVVPEPATSALLAIGLACLLLVGRRTAKSRA